METRGSRLPASMRLTSVAWTPLRSDICSWLSSRICTRMRARAEGEREMQEQERADAKVREERTLALLATCRRVLEELGRGSSASS